MVILNSWIDITLEGINQADSSDPLYKHWLRDSIRDTNSMLHTLNHNRPPQTGCYEDCAMRHLGLKKVSERRLVSNLERLRACPEWYQELAEVALEDINERLTAFLGS